MKTFQLKVNSEQAERTIIMQNKQEMRMEMFRKGMSADEMNSELEKLFPSTA